MRGANKMKSGAAKKTSQPKKTSKLSAKKLTVVDFQNDLKTDKPKIANHSAANVSLRIERRLFTPKEIKAIRKSLCMSLALFAEFIGVDTSVVTRWERGSGPQWSANRFLQEIENDPVYWRSAWRNCPIQRQKNIKLGATRSIINSTVGKCRAVQIISLLCQAHSLACSATLSAHTHARPC